MTTTTRWVLVLTGLGSLMAALDTLVVAAALTTLRVDLGASVEELEWTVNAYNLSFAVLMITAAALGDRYGRRRLYAAGLALFAAASAACALAPDVGWLIAARAVQGVGAALILPLGLALLSAAFPPERRGAAIGIFSAITGLAVASGPLVGGAVVEGLAWEWVFWLNVPIGLAAIPFVLTKMRESYGGDTGLDIPGLVLVTGGALGLVWGLVRGNAAGWGSAEVVGALAAGALLLAAFVVWERRAREPMLPLRLFRSRAFSAGNAAMFFTFASLFGAVFFFAQLLQTGLGHGALDTGLRLIPWTVTFLTVAPVAGTLADRVGDYAASSLSAAFGGVSVSHAAACPSDALLSTLRESSAHFRRVAEISMPRRSSTKLRSSLSRSSIGMPMTSSEAIDADACEIAQPWPEKRTSCDLAVAVDLELDLQLVAAQRVEVLRLEVGVLELAPVMRGLVVLQDVLAVEVVHQANTSRTVPSASIRPVDLVARGVHGERGAGRGGDAEPAHQRLRAGMAGAHADALAADDLGHVVRMDAVERERGDAAAVLDVGPEEREAGDLAQALDGVADDVARVLPHGVHADAGEEVGRGAEPDRLGDHHRARLELGGRLGRREALLGHAGDHVPAAEERRHRLEQLAAAVQHADAGRAVGLVAGPGVEVGVERGDVDRHVRHRLHAVDDHHGAGGVRAARDLGDRVDGAEHVRHVRDGDELRLVGQRVVERVHVEQPVVGDRAPTRSGSRGSATARCSSGAPSA